MAQTKKAEAKHEDLYEIQNSPPPFQSETILHQTQIPNVNWERGQGANDTDDAWRKHQKISIDPYSEGRTPADNYKLLVSGVVPRPIGFVSSINKEGRRNLAPFSYFSVANSDPPIFTLAFSSGSGMSKDTANNILETGELTINIISEWFIEAANYTSINSPPGVDEWILSGLTPQKSKVVKPEHVAESAFSIEAKLVHFHEYQSKKLPAKTTGTLLIVEGVQFHVREDIINKDRNLIDFAKLKPMARLGGVLYGRVTEGFEIPRPNYEEEEHPSK